MAKAILLVREKKPVGVFTQLKKTYGAIETYQGREVTPDCTPINDLWLPFPKESKQCNYARLNKFMTDNGGRAALFTEDNKEYPLYTLYQFEINSVDGVESSEEPEVDNNPEEELNR